MSRGLGRSSERETEGGGNERVYLGVFLRSSNYNEIQWRWFKMVDGEAAVYSWSEKKRVETRMRRKKKEKRQENIRSFRVECGRQPPSPIFPPQKRPGRSDDQ